MIGKNWLDCIAPDDPINHQRGDRALCMQQLPPRFQCRMRDADGATKRFSIETLPSCSTIRRRNHTSAHASEEICGLMVVVDDLGWSDRVFSPVRQCLASLIDKILSRHDGEIRHIRQPKLPAVEIDSVDIQQILLGMVQAANGCYSNQTNAAVSSRIEIITIADAESVELSVVLPDISTDQTDAVGGKCLQWEGLARRNNATCWHTSFDTTHSWHIRFPIPPRSARRRS